MSSVRTSIYIKVLSALSFTGMATCIKALDGAILTGQVVFFRSFFALVPLLIWLRTQGDARALIRTRNVRGHLIRGVSGSCSMFFTFIALACLPMADAIMIGYAAPMLTVVLAAILLGEAVQAYRWLSVVLGFTGVMVVIAPQFIAYQGSRPGALEPVFLAGAACGLAGATFSALSSVQIRHMTQTESPGAIVLYFSLLTSLIGALTVVLGWKAPSADQLLLLVGAGIFGGVGQTLMTVSIRHAEASLIAPFEYTTMLWTVLIAYLIFDQPPAFATVVGGALIAGSGFYTIWRESRAKASNAEQ